MLKPTYIGLREYLNMPEVTNEEAVSGFKGLTVVAAARNEMPPEMAKPMPSINNTMVVTRVCWSLSIAAVGVAVEIAQISRAKSKPTMGGGILVSSVFMGLILAFYCEFWLSVIALPLLLFRLASTKRDRQYGMNYSYHINLEAQDANGKKDLFNHRNTQSLCQRAC